MNAYLIIFVFGLGLGSVFGWKGGQAHARALRAWRDLKALKQSIRGQIRSAVDHWKTAAGWIAVGATVGALVIVLVGVNLHLR